MKKFFLTAFLFSLLLSAGMIITWFFNHPNKPYSTASWRFMEKENGKTTFNWASLLSPAQWEAQEFKKDTTSFTTRVIYPKLKQHFDLEVPGDSSAESLVANKIAQTIADSLNRIRLNLNWNYDNHMKRVRSQINPPTVKAAAPSATFSLTGTASPEAVMYGFEESIQPNHLEPENAQLAKQRLDRTSTIIEHNLDTRGLAKMIVHPIHTEAKELQLRPTQVDSVLKNPALLDDMRYVDAHVVITAGRVVVTPFTFPILLPLWILLAWGIATLLTRKREKEVAVVAHEDQYIEHEEVVDEPKKKKDPWWYWLLLILFIIGAIIVIYLNLIRIIIVAIILAIWGLFLLLYYILREKLWKFFRWVRTWLIVFFLWVRYQLRRFWRFIKRWWPRKWYCNVLLIWFLITFPIAVYMFIKWL